MSRSFPADTQIQKFLEESYNKETDTRISWYKKSKNEAKIQSKQFEVFKKRMEGACPKPAGALLGIKDVKPKSYHKRLTKIDLDFSRLDGKEKKIDTDMSPVEPWVRSKLYDGFTKQGKGRYDYLRHRYVKDPETKYQYPVLSSWEYGWRLSDIIRKEDIRKPVSGRTRIVADTFYTRNGIPALQCSATH